MFGLYRCGLVRLDHTGPPAGLLLSAGLAGPDRHGLAEMSTGLDCQDWIGY